MKRLGLLVFLAGCAEAGAPPALPPHASPLDPLEERASFQLPPGFEVSLVAALQAFIFATLTAIYLGGAVAEEH